MLNIKFDVPLSLDLPRPIIYLFRHSKALVRGVYPVISGMHDLLNHHFFNDKNWRVIFEVGSSSNMGCAAALIKTAVNYRLVINSLVPTEQTMESFFDLINAYVVSGDHEVVGEMRLGSGNVCDVLYVHKKPYALLKSELMGRVREGL